MMEKYYSDYGEEPHIQFTWDIVQNRSGIFFVQNIGDEKFKVNLTWAFYNSVLYDGWLILLIIGTS